MLVLSILTLIIVAYAGATWSGQCSFVTPSIDQKYKKRWFRERGIFVSLTEAYPSVEDNILYSRR